MNNFTVEIKRCLIYSAVWHDSSLRVYTQLSYIVTQLNVLNYPYFVITFQPIIDPLKKSIPVGIKLWQQTLKVRNQMKLEVHNRNETLNNSV
jgi:hypothetical protein